jgi:hypothetical protein
MSRVLQRYISPPLLLRKRKFHIRAYALAVSALRVYLSRNYLVLLSGTKYSEDTNNMFAHITNTAFQDLDKSFVERDCIRLWSDDEIGRILLQDGTCRDSEDASRKINFVMHQMEQITAEVFNAYKNEISVLAPIEGCFEHFGLDFVVRSDWNVYLLEINPGPDFKQTGERLGKVIEELMCDTVDAALLDQQANSIGSLKLVYQNEMRRRSGQDGINMRLT